MGTNIQRKQKCSLRTRSEDTPVCINKVEREEPGQNDPERKQKDRKTWCHEAKGKEYFMDKIFNCEIKKLINVFIG